VGGGDVARAETQHVGVVLHAGEPGGFRIVAKRGADAPDLVCGDSGARPAAADEHARVDEAAEQGLSYGPGIVGIVDGVRREGAEIQEIVAVGLERSRDVFLEQKPGVVTAYGDPHGSAALFSLKIPLERQRFRRAVLGAGEPWHRRHGGADRA